MQALPRHAGFQAIVLAAGKGQRMGASIPKVLVPLLGRPLIEYVLERLAEVGISHPVIVISPAGELVRARLGDAYQYVVQAEQLGSGHAVLCARDTLRHKAEQLIVMCGDSPLFKTQTLRLLMETHLSVLPTITLVTAVLKNPHGYGRVIRDTHGEIKGIVEEVEATGDQKDVKEVNGGCYAFESEWLWENLDSMTVNDAGEKCLTQMVRIAVSQGRRVISVQAEPEEILGVNTPEDLVLAEKIMASRVDLPHY